MTNLLFLSPVNSLCLCGQVSLHLHRHPFQPQYFKCGHYANYTLCLSALVLCSYCHLPAEFITTFFISYVLVPVANILNRLKKKKKYIPDFGGNFFFPPQSPPPPPQLSSYLGQNDINGELSKLWHFFFSFSFPFLSSVKRISMWCGRKIVKLMVHAVEFSKIALTFPRRWCQN